MTPKEIETLKWLAFDSGGETQALAAGVVSLISALEAEKAEVERLNGALNLSIQNSVSELIAKKAAEAALKDAREKAWDAAIQRCKDEIRAHGYNFHIGKLDVLLSKQDSGER